MSPFEFFFSFYGLLLGFSVAELVGGFARLLHQRQELKFGVLTPLLAIFVAFDIATFWNQAWVIFRNAPFSLALLTLGMIVAGVFYVAATLVFPREPTSSSTGAGETLDAHFWKNRRIVLLCVLAANWLIAGPFLLMTGFSGELARLRLDWIFWSGLTFFGITTLVAAFAPGKRVVLGALSLLVAYQVFTVGRTAVALIQSGGWSVLQAG